jgi:hypothetical protein
MHISIKSISATILKLCFTAVVVFFCAVFFKPNLWFKFAHPYTGLRSMSWDDHNPKIEFHIPILRGDHPHNILIVLGETISITDTGNFYIIKFFDGNIVNSPPHALGDILLVRNDGRMLKTTYLIKDMSLKQIVNARKLTELPTIIHEFIIANVSDYEFPKENSVTD